MNNRWWTAIFRSKFFFSDEEAHFTLAGYVNKQNCRICGSENPQVIEEMPLHPEIITVWYALWSEVVIELYLFKNDDGITVTINSEQYGHTITYACIISRRDDINWPP